MINNYCLTRHGIIHLLSFQCQYLFIIYHKLYNWLNTYDCKQEKKMIDKDHKHDLKLKK